MIRWTVLSLILFAGIGCEAPLATPATTRSELYFGLSREGGQTISEEQWQGFLREVVTPRFPDGFSVVNATGQYRSQKGELVHEDSRILILLHPTTPDEDQKLEDIRRVYKERFGQESVLRIDQAGIGKF